MLNTEDQLEKIIYADFVIEDSEIQPLDHRVVKKFTSLAKSPITTTNIYDPTIFRWNFGDGTPIVETGKREIYHIYEHPGKYLVKHQACNFCACSNWNICYKMIKIKDKEDEENNQNNHENNNNQEKSSCPTSH